MEVNVNVTFLRNAAAVYGDGNPANALVGLSPATISSVGIDLRACLEHDQIVIPTGERAAIGCGIAIEPLPLDAPLSGISPSNSPSNSPNHPPDSSPSLSASFPALASLVLSRSGLGAKEGLVVAQGVGLIDPDYRGEITTWLLNTSKFEKIVKQGDRVAQLVFFSYFTPKFNLVNALSSTKRGAGGFGHTGK